jgi:hypothetical protein
MDISKGARRGTHLNGLERYYICYRVKENKHIQLHMGTHLQWIHPQQIKFQSNMHMCQSQNTQLKQKQLNIKWHPQKTGQLLHKYRTTPSLKYNNPGNTKVHINRQKLVHRKRIIQDKVRT